MVTHQSNLGFLGQVLESQRPSPEDLTLLEKEEASSSAAYAVDVLVGTVCQHLDSRRVDREQLGLTGCLSRRRRAHAKLQALVQS